MLGSRAVAPCHCADECAPRAPPRWPCVCNVPPGQMHFGTGLGGSPWHGGACAGPADGDSSGFTPAGSEGATADLPDTSFTVKGQKENYKVCFHAHEIPIALYVQTLQGNPGSDINMAKYEPFVHILLDFRDKNALLCHIRNGFENYDFQCSVPFSWSGAKSLARWYAKLNDHRKQCITLEMMSSESIPSALIKKVFRVKPEMQETDVLHMNQLKDADILTLGEYKFAFTDQSVRMQHNDKLVFHQKYDLGRLLFKADIVRKKTTCIVVYGYLGDAKCVTLNAKRPTEDQVIDFAAEVYKLRRTGKSFIELILNTDSAYLLAQFKGYFDKVIHSEIMDQEVAVKTKPELVLCHTRNTIIKLTFSHDASVDIHYNDETIGISEGQLIVVFDATQRLQPPFFHVTQEQMTDNRDEYTLGKRTFFETSWPDLQRIADTYNKLSNEHKKLVQLILYTRTPTNKQIQQAFHVYTGNAGSTRQV